MDSAWWLVAVGVDMGSNYRQWLVAAITDQLD